ncbi:carbohydrate ABC transporter permease [Micromonospora sp. NPDC005305]|uniref:carbohydrate ABC transporter permease n=1 Tax=Micromonospora sp. NPDC005305 TaxID=3156875 RepID=UPI0033A92CDB
MAAGARKVGAPPISVGRKAALYAGLTLAAIVSIGPILWALLTSVKPHELVVSSTPVWLFRPTLDNYATVFWYSSYGTYTLNSLLVAGAATLVSVLLGALAAYGFARLKFRGSAFLQLFILATRFLPFVAVVVPYYLLMNTLGLLDTHLALILAYVSFSLPFSTWMMIGFFADVPKELDESAMVDGCTRFGAFRRVILPLTLPGMAATAMISFLVAWNEFFFAVVLTNTSARTVQVGVTAFLDNPQTGSNWELISAAAVIAMLPLLVLATFAQKYLVRGLTFGAVNK